MKKIIFILICFLVGTLLTSCETMGTKESIGGVIGGGIGGILGNKASSKKDRNTGTALGVAIGAWLGSGIGRHLDEQDRMRMEQTTRRALATGQTQTWSNPDNKTRGESRVVATQKKTDPIKVPVLKDKVKQVPPLDIVAENYRAKGQSNLRGGPGTDYEKVGTLQAHEVVNVVGKVKNSDWFFVAQDGVGSGFVLNSLLEHAPDAGLPPPSTPVAQGEIVEHQIAPERVCRTIKQSVSLSDGKQDSETIEACQGANGWEVKA